MLAVSATMAAQTLLLFCHYENDLALQQERQQSQERVDRARRAEYEAVAVEKTEDKEEKVEYQYHDPLNYAPLRDSAVWAPKFHKLAGPAGRGWHW